MPRLIVANWKMNPQSLPEAKKLFNSIKNWVKRNSNVLKNIRIIICPPFVYLESLSKLLRTKSCKLKAELGAQDLFWEDSDPPTPLPPSRRAPKGAFTGEISPKMLKNLGVGYVIVGHSERRKILEETDEMINKKLKAAIKAKLKPILCIGETLEERKKGKTFKILKSQLTKALYHLTTQPLIHSATKPLRHLILAYEPVWSIGTGNPCKPKDAKEVLTFLRKLTQPLFHSTTQPLILYGGSVNSKNAKDYIEVGFDGLLVGGASLDSKEFIGIIKSLLKS
jgi:triosephosphate isomerase